MSDAPILITAALPYANGPLHLGHMLEYMQADIWTRALRSFGRRAYFVCADDCHGTAVMLKAASQGKTPEEWIEEMALERRADFAACGIHFDAYGNTHALSVRKLAESLFRTMSAQGLIVSRIVEQLYDVEAGLFLSDRYVKGVCPRCGAPDQYGDHCEQCGATYMAIELKHPRSTLSRSLPEKRSSAHWFLRLSDPRCVTFLREWTRHVLPEAHYRKLSEWLGEPGAVSPLTDWDISRDEPYFGFPIPDTVGKYFYVWWDAPIAYMAMTHLLPDGAPCFEDFWCLDSQAEIYHCIGKDIVYFHALFWPALLHFSGYRTPTSLCVHGFVTINGEKMSKSRGTFITVRQYLSAGLPTEYLRYYLASKLNDTAADVDFCIPDFVQKVHADLIGKYSNIFSRLAGLLMRHYGGVCTDWTLSQCDLCAGILAQKEAIMNAYTARHFHQAMRLIMAEADRVNQFIDERKPWLLAKEADESIRLQAVLTRGLYAFCLLTAYLSPVLPTTCAIVAQDVLRQKPQCLSFQEIAHLRIPRIYSSQHLFQKMDVDAVTAVLLGTNS